MNARCIGIDARYLSHNLIGGVHTYVREMTTALLAAAPERRWILYADAKAPFELPSLPPNATLRTLPWRSGASTLRNDLLLGRTMARDGVDVAQYPANYGFAPAHLPLVVTLHDAINLLPLHEILRGHAKRPKTMLTMTYLHLFTRQAMRQRPLVVTVSEYSRREIVRLSGLPDDRVRVVYQAPDATFRRLEGAETHAFASRLGLQRRVLVADAIKNPLCALRAFRALPQDIRDHTSLVYFARRPPASEVQRAARAGECLLLLRPSRDELVMLHNLADFFLFPSWYEGFGLPAVEAMACGSPVIASSSGSLPEIVGDGGIIVGAEDHGAIARAIATLFEDDAAHARLRALALASAARFSWERGARQLLQIFDEAASAAQARVGDVAHRVDTSSHPR